MDPFPRDVVHLLLTENILHRFMSWFHVLWHVQLYWLKFSLHVQKCNVKHHRFPSVIVKYARHVRQTSANVRQGDKHCRTFYPAGFNTHKMSDKENKNDQGYLPVINWEKCLTGVQNVRQGAEGLLDILSGTPEMILAITVPSVKRFIYLTSAILYSIAHFQLAVLFN